MAQSHIKVLPYSEFEPGVGGYVVCTPHGSDWAIPAWEERGYGDLAKVFPTETAALGAIQAETI